MAVQLTLTFCMQNLKAACPTDMLELKIFFPRALHVLETLFMGHPLDQGKCLQKRGVP